VADGAVIALWYRYRCFSHPADVCWIANVVVRSFNTVQWFGLGQTNSVVSDLVVTGGVRKGILPTEILTILVSANNNTLAKK